MYPGTIATFYDQAYTLDIKRKGAAMKNRRIIVIVIGCMCFLLTAISIAKADNAGSIADQLNSELQQSGVVTRNEADAIKSLLKNMVNKGAGKEELRDVVTELSNHGVKGDDLKKSIKSMNDLVNKGENPREAGSVVSRAAAQAHADGLKGKDLAAKVHEAIGQRKAQMDEAKKKDKKAKKDSEKTKKDVQKNKGGLKR